MSSEARSITRKAKSNLAFALGILPKQKRQDMTSFYAYCRSIDDLADDTSIPLDQRRGALAEWKQGLVKGFGNPSALQQEISELCQRQDIPTELMVAIIEGCEMDLDKTRYQSWEELDGYIWKVSCAVGLVCIRIFGCVSPESRAYAEALGRALQLTNILRDVGEDMREHDRIYLPLQDLRQFGYGEEDLEQARHDERFVNLMRFEAARAMDFYEEATIQLTPQDRSALRPALIMQEFTGNY